MKYWCYSKAPIWWTEEEWEMTPEEREKAGIKIIKFETFKEYEASKNRKLRIKSRR